MNYTRQMEIFDPAKFGNTPVHIIGAGATGSWLALFLAKMGVKNLHVYDFDKVEEHNLPNQVYRMNSMVDGNSDIGHLKVDVLGDVIFDAIGSDILHRHINEVKEDSGDRFAGIVFVLTDTMFSRKKIFEKYLKYNAAVELMVETRMGAEHGRIYAIDPRNIKHIRGYEQTLYTDEDASTSACGASQTIIATAVNIASRAAWKLIKWHKGLEYDNEVIIDLQNNNILTRKFE